MLFGEILAFLLAGLVAGFLAGLLGSGGGLIFVTAQILIYSIIHMPIDLQMKTAVGTSLATIVFTTLSSSRAHARRKSVQWEVIYKIAAGVIIGAICGTIFARLIPSKVLEIVFGIFMIVAGLYFFFVKSFKESVEHRIPNYLTFNLIGWCIGTLSTMLGVGGGVLTVPTLAHFRIPLRKSIGTSSVVTFILSFFGAIAYMFPGAGSVPYFKYSIGYLYLPAFIPMAVGAVVAAQFGAHMTHILPRVMMKRAYAIFIFIVGLVMIIR